MTLGDLKVRTKNSMAVCTFNTAKANPRRADGIIRELLASIDMENVVVCLQECGRWQHLNGRVVGDHFAFGSSHSDCMILLPTVFVPLVKKHLVWTQTHTSQIGIWRYHLPVGFCSLDLGAHAGR